MRSTFTISSPPDTRGETTFIGAGRDDIERTAFAPKNLLLNQDNAVRVFGKIRLITHPPMMVTGVCVKAWHEIRICPAVELK